MRRRFVTTTRSGFDDNDPSATPHAIGTLRLKCSQHRDFQRPGLSMITDMPVSHASLSVGEPVTPRDDGPISIRHITMWSNSVGLSAETGPRRVTM